MKLYSDYHIHSKYSKNGHCKSELEEIVVTAIDRGLKEIAVSDHGIRHFFYGTSEKNIIKARKEIDILKEKYPEIDIKLGIEANLISYDGDTDITQVIVDNCDVILVGIHFGVIFKGLWGSIRFFKLNFLGRFISPLRKYMAGVNTDGLIKAMEKYEIDIITHPGDKVPVDIERLAQAAERTNTALEINNSHRHLNVEEIRTASKYKVDFYIGSDAHVYEAIGEFSDSCDRIEKAGLEKDRIVNLEV